MNFIAAARVINRVRLELKQCPMDDEGIYKMMYLAGLGTSESIIKMFTSIFMIKVEDGFIFPDRPVFVGGLEFRMKELEAKQREIKFLKEEIKKLQERLNNLNKKSNIPL